MHNQTKKQVSINIAIVVVVAVVAFYGGDLYGKSSVQASLAGNGGRGGAMGAGGMNRSRAFGAGMGVLSGEVISKDDTSVTLKLRDGGSRIGFVGSSTAVSKSVEGAFSDVQVGNQVMVIGKSNPDGSVNAQSIQIRPDMMQKQQ